MRDVLRDTLSFIFHAFYRFSNNIDVGKNSIVSWHIISAKKSNKVIIGENSIFRARVIFEEDNGVLSVGHRSYIGKSKLICKSSIDIGDDVIMSWGVTIVDHDSHSLNWPERENDIINWINGVKDWSNVSCAPVKIENKAWVGFGVSILKGVTVEEGAVIAAGSVVTKDVPAFSLVAGNPAKIIRLVK